MFKDEKQVITNEKIRDDLKAFVKGELIAALVFWVLLIVVNAIFALILYLLKGCAFAQTQAVQTILTVLGWVTWIVPIVYPVYRLLKACRYFRILNNGEFHVEEDELVRMAKDEFNVRHFLTTVVDADARLISSYEDAFYFDRHGRVVVGRKMFDYASCGDSFYVVTTAKSDIPVLVYNTKMYEYRKSS